MIHLDTSVLVDAFTGARRSERRVRRTIEDGERLAISAVVLYEWLRGPRIAAELALQEALFPADAAVAFGPEEASVAARLSRAVTRARGREIDLALAACALTHHAAVWTLNPEDFRDVPELSLYSPSALRREDER